MFIWLTISSVIEVQTIFAMAGKQNEFHNLFPSSVGGELSAKKVKEMIMMMGHTSGDLLQVQAITQLKPSGSEVDFRTHDPKVVSF